MYELIAITFVITLILSLTYFKEKFIVLDYATPQVQTPIESVTNSVDNYLISIKDAIISADVSKFKFDLPSTNETVKIVYINQEELDYILDKFIEHLNQSQEYSFTKLSVGKPTLVMTSDTEKVIKSYNIPLFLFENTKKFVKRIIVDIDVIYATNGMITIKNLIIPSDAVFTEKILPSYIPTEFNFSDVAKTPTPKDAFMLIDKEDAELERLRQIKIKTLRESYTCSGIPDSEKIESELECMSFGGVWDRPVETDQSCPFYNANKNYPNNRGGAKTDYCEMPSGVLIKGYRHYEQDPEKYNPLCYNCKDKLIGQGTLGLCCDEQKSNSLEYPTLKGPDYKFPGDILDRQNAGDLLKQLKLSPN